MSKLKLTILTLLILALGIVAFSYLTLRQAQGDKNQNTNVIPVKTGIQEKEIDTSDWKTYRNEELGVSFDYPEFSIYPNSPPHTVTLQSNGLLVADSAYITVFNIDSGDPKDYIKNTLLREADPRCAVKISENLNSLPSGYKIYFIRGEDPNDPNADGYGLLYLLDCTSYAGAGATSYFIFNKDLPNKLLHLSFYQDSSMSQEQVNIFRWSIRIF